MDNLLVMDLDTELVCCRENVEINIDILIDHSYIYAYKCTSVYEYIHTYVFMKPIGLSIHARHPSMYWARPHKRTADSFKKAGICWER